MHEHEMNQRTLNIAREVRRLKGEVKIKCSDGRTIGQGDFEGRSIHPQGTKVTRATRMRNQAKQRQNRLMRAALHQDCDGEIPAHKIPEWHTKLNALSLGTLG